MASQLYEGGIFQQAAVPWWLTFKQNPNSEYANDFQFYDKTTGKQVYQDASGNFFYELPRAERFDVGEDGQWQTIAGTPGQAVTAPADPLNAEVLGASGVNGLAQIRLADGTVTTGTQLQGDASDYAKLFEGMVPGSPGYMQVPGQGASETQVVKGSDGNYYAAQPSNAQFVAARPDNSGFGSLFAQGFLPIITAALSGGLGNGLSSSLAETLGGGLTGQIGSKALVGGATSLLSGGDGLTGALSAGLGGALGGALPSLDLGLPSYATSALTGGLGAAIGGGDPLTGALLGAGSNLASGALGDLGLPAPVTSAVLGGAKSLIGGGDPLVGALMAGGSGLLGQVAKSPNYQYTMSGGDQPSSVDVQNIPQDTWTSGYDVPSMNNAATGRDLVNSFSSNPSPSTTVDTLAANTTGPNPAQAWGDSVDNMDSFLGQFAASPSPVNSDLAISGNSQQTAGQPLSEPFQQPASSLPWDQPAGSLNTYTEQQPVTTPAEPVTTSPASGGENMAFFDDLLAQNLWGDGTVPEQVATTPDYSQSGENPPNPSSLWPTTGVADPIYNLDGTAGSNYLNYGVMSDPSQMDPNQTYWPTTPDQAVQPQSSWEKLIASLNPTLASGLTGLTNAVKSNTGQNMLMRGLAAAPALAAINYARNQTPYDTSKLSSVYDQMNPSAQVGMYDLASGQQKNALQSDLARRQVSGSSFGDQSLASFNTIRDLGRNALLNQGLAGQADVAAKMVDAQAKQRAAQNQLYGSALYALGGVLSPRTGILG